MKQQNVQNFTRTRIYIYIIMKVAEGITSVLHDYKLDTANLSSDAYWLAMETNEELGNV